MKLIIRSLASLVWAILMLSCSHENTSKVDDQENQQAFSFAFMTDLHLNFSKEQSFDAFAQAVETAKDLGVDFIITGGDNVDADVVGEDEGKARSMFAKFKNIIDQSDIEIKVSMGNHDRFWYQDESTAQHGAAMFLDYFPATYYSHTFNGVHFIHLNTSEVCEGKYCVSQTQRTWIGNTLATIDPKAPIVVIAHVPFLSFYYPALYGYYTHTDVFDGFKEVWDMFKGHNLALVLQGHMHLYEELNVLDTQFITGGALSGNWWNGEYHGTPEGFVKVDWDGEKFQWEYVGFGWNP